MRKLLIAAAISVTLPATTVAVEGAAEARDPLTRQGACDAALGVHPKNTDNDVKIFKEDNFWLYGRLDPDRATPSNCAWGEKLDAYHWQLHATWWGSYWPNTKSAHYGYIFVVRTADNGINDAANKSPAGW